MMILPLASTIQNSLQDLTSRICGVDTNAQATQAFAMGGVAGGAIGYGISAIKEQFKTPAGDSNSDVIPNGNANTKQEKANTGTGKGSKVASALKTGAKGTAKAAGAYLSMGRRMVEGDANVNFKNKANEPKKQMQHTEYINNMRENQPKERLGEKNEHKG